MNPFKMCGKFRISVKDTNHSRSLTECETCLLQYSSKLVTFFIGFLRIKDYRIHNYNSAAALYGCGTWFSCEWKNIGQGCPDILALEDETSTLFQNVGHWLPTSQTSGDLICWGYSKIGRWRKCLGVTGRK